MGKTLIGIILIVCFNFVFGQINPQDYIDISATALLTWLEHVNILDQISLAESKRSDIPQDFREIAQKVNEECLQLRSKIASNLVIINDKNAFTWETFVQYCKDHSKSKKIITINILSLCQLDLEYQRLNGILKQCQTTIQCQACNGQGWIICPECKNGFIIEKKTEPTPTWKDCANCGGNYTKTRQVPCRSCDGRGYWSIKPDPNCEQCHGSGRVEIRQGTNTVGLRNCNCERKIHCSGCQGSGIINITSICPHCTSGKIPGYTTRMIELKIPCQKCSQSGKLTCQTCLGKGVTITK